MAKEHPIDTAVREYRALQDKNAESAINRRAEIVLLTVTAALLVAFGIGIWLLPHKSVSEEENRPLQDFPKFEAEAFLSGEYTADIATFYADQFPLRNQFVGLKALSEFLLLKQENNGVLIGKNGYLIDRLEYTDDAYQNLENNLDAVKGFAELAKTAGTECSFFAAPRTVDVMQTSYPFLYANERAQVIPNRIAERSPDALLLCELLSERAENGEYVMYKTDHHWTTLGAYYAYSALGETLGYEPLPLSYFKEETVSEDFLGTTYSKSGIKWQESDSITLFSAEDDGDYTVTVHDSGETRVGFYDESYLSVKDKYSVFLGGNYGHVSVTKNGAADRPTLLLVKDSYALSTVPFLARHFDLELIDLRYFSGSTADLLTGAPDAAGTTTVTKADKVLILMGIDTLAESDVLRKLMYGVSSR